MLRIERFKPYLRQIPLIFCLALAAGVVAIWVRSYFVADRYRWISFDRSEDWVAYTRLSVGTGLGGMNFSYNYERTSEPGHRNLLEQLRTTTLQTRPSGYSQAQPPRYPLRGGSDDSTLGSLGFGWFYLPERVDDGAGRRLRMGLTVPVWSVFAACMSYPFAVYVAGVLRRQREDRIALGLCPRCGYAVKDDAQRCPGCDRPVPAGLVRHA